MVLFVYALKEKRGVDCMNCKKIITSTVAAFLFYVATMSGVTVSAATPDPTVGVVDLGVDAHEKSEAELEAIATQQITEQLNADNDGDFYYVVDGFTSALLKYPIPTFARNFLEKWDRRAAVADCGERYFDSGVPYDTERQYWDAIANAIPIGTIVDAFNRLT